MLRDLPDGGYRYVIDMGCGPGFTTALLREAIPHSFATGIDASPAMIAEARARVPDAHFAVADVTAPLSLPAHLVYARLLLGHLPDPGVGAGDTGRPRCGPGVCVVCEEPVRYRSDDPVFARYEAARHRGRGRARRHAVGRARARRRSARMPARRSTASSSIRCPRPRAAAMFWRNAATWGGEPDLVDALQEIETRAARRDRHVGIAPDGVDENRRLSRRPTSIWARRRRRYDHS